MKTIRLFPTLVMVIGVLFTCGGLVITGAGIVIHGFVGEQLRSQQITTPADASIPNAPVTGIATVLSMAALIQHHAADSSNGLSYAQMGRFAVASGDPSGTNTVDAALKDAMGQPVANQARTTQLTAASLVTSLSLSAMALGASYGAMALGIGFFILGLIITGLGYALRGLITPEVAARFGIQPVSA
ncbi:MULTISPECIES: hypothetical protein [Herpetosiphon]|uniref:Aromatic ring-opening dioxygenase LigA n=1 Tax=Herpetosiphon geysericola TaxID=70996 RepID=A0A0P6XRU7_9CHLR|nr:hypothetical protein [Herpetosiphon geysericola]KPL86929.1 hypothetical protein SE18_11400 [Herpetosiphon geysericola]